MFRLKKQRELVPRRRNKFGRVLKKIVISFVVMVTLAFAAGVAYVYFSNHDTPVPSDAIKEIAPAIPKHVPQADNNLNGAAVQYISSPIAPGENANIIIITGADSDCTIVVAYGKVVSKDSGLAPKKADVHGSVAWTWTVDKTAEPGKGIAKVTCTRNKKVGYVEGYFEVTK